eukprot:PhF_6_TR9706/c0_g1_i1/m.14933
MQGKFSVLHRQTYNGKESIRVVGTVTDAAHMKLPPQVLGTIVGSLRTQRVSSLSITCCEFTETDLDEFLSVLVRDTGLHDMTFNRSLTWKQVCRVLLILTGHPSIRTLTLFGMERCVWDREWMYTIDLNSKSLRAIRFINCDFMVGVPMSMDHITVSRLTCSREEEIQVAGEDENNLPTSRSHIDRGGDPITMKEVESASPLTVEIWQASKLCGKLSPQVDCEGGQIILGSGAFSLVLRNPTLDNIYAKVIVAGVIGACKYHIKPNTSHALTSLRKSGGITHPLIFLGENVLLSVQFFCRETNDHVQTISAHLCTAVDPGVRQAQLSFRSCRSPTPTPRKSTKPSQVQWDSPSALAEMIRVRMGFTRCASPDVFQIPKKLPTRSPRPKKKFH